MHQCDIMVKDVDDSKRLNANVHTTIKAKAADAKAKGEGGEGGPRVAGGGHHGGEGEPHFGMGDVSVALMAQSLQDCPPPPVTVTFSKTTPSIFESESPLQVK